MDSHLPKIEEDGEIGDLSTVDASLFKPFDSLPESLRKKLGGRPVGSKKPNAKISINVRVSPDVLEAMRASGPGWGGRIDDVLRAAWIPDSAAPPKKAVTATPSGAQ